jgi:hypothetical protein
MRSPCNTVESCLEYRSESFLPVYNLIADQWKESPCRNCKVGIQRAHEVAAIRTPSCGSCDSHIYTSTSPAFPAGAIVCRKCSAKKSRNRRMGPPCKTCGIPLGRHAVKEKCLECQGEERREKRMEKRRALSCGG